MSEKTLGIIGTVLISFGFGAVLGEYRGHSEMKRWQDTYYSAHPVQEVPVESNCPTVLVGVVGIFTGECWIPFDDQVNFWKNAPKPQNKQNKRQPPVVKPGEFLCYESQGDGAVLPRRCTDAELREGFRQIHQGAGSILQIGGSNNAAITNGESKP